MNSGKFLVAGIVVLIAIGIALFVNRPKPQVAISSNPTVNRNAAHVLRGQTAAQRKRSIRE